MSSTSPSTSIYPPPNEAYSAYRYADPIDPQIPRGYPGQYQAQPESPPQHKHAPVPAKQKTPSSEVKNRLRKACDSCSVRKVKCDESGPPCKSCAALDIPCTFQRPSRRRGPPNKHAEAIKRQKLEDGSYKLSTGSPTHDAAYSLAALATPAPLSAESICDLPTLQVLLDDYFLYIHPVIPLPHEPTFRAAFARREDRTDRSFLSMVATMLEVLVASFPRRPMQVFTSEQARQQFPSAHALIDKCHQVFVEARGPGYLDRNLNLYDVLSSYLAGLASAYVFNVERMHLYFGECVMLLRQKGFHRSEIPAQRFSSPPGAYALTESPASPPGNYIYQQSGRRLFWLCFVAAMSMRSLDEAEGDILMPPVAHAEMLPPLPVEVDDEFITETTILSQPHGIVSILTGFNLNVKVFRALHALAALELAFGANVMFDWDRQRHVIFRALQNVKAATVDAPKELQLDTSNMFGEWPPSAVSAYPQHVNAGQDPSSNIMGISMTGNGDRGPVSPSYPKRAIQFEIQKANIYATQLSTRSYLVERFWNLYEIHDRDRASSTERVPLTSSPTAGAMISGVDHRYSHAARTPSDSQMDHGEQSMAVEREDIVRDLAVLLRSINQVNMEPNGLSFCNKIRQIASTLLETKRARMSMMPTLDSETVNNYLYGFLDILSKLERLGPGRIHAGNINAYGSNKTAEEIEEEELVHWASLKEHQERFVRSQGFMAGV